MADIYVLDFSTYGRPSHMPEVFVNLLPPPKITFQEAERQTGESKSEMDNYELEEHYATLDRSCSCCSQSDLGLNINLISTVYPLTSANLWGPPELPNCSRGQARRSASPSSVDSTESQSSRSRRRRISSHRRISNVQRQASSVTLDSESSTVSAAAEFTTGQNITSTPEISPLIPNTRLLSRIQLTDSGFSPPQESQRRSRSV